MAENMLPGSQARDRNRRRVPQRPAATFGFDRTIVPNNHHLNDDRAKKSSNGKGPARRRSGFGPVPNLDILTPILSEKISDAPPYDVNVLAHVRGSGFRPE
jgi:hypothetical protein